LTRHQAQVLSLEDAYRYNTKNIIPKYRTQHGISVLEKIIFEKSLSFLTWFPFILNIIGNAATYAQSQANAIPETVLRFLQ